MIGAQPRGRRGTVGQPYSALNLRLGLALFGLVFCGVVGGFLLAWGHLTVLAWILLALALFAAIDVVVVQLRRRARKREEDGKHSIFE
jgi:Flp pilus assembly protein TadB